MAIYIVFGASLSSSFRGYVEWNLRFVRESRWIHTVSDQMLLQLKDNAPVPGSLMTLILDERITPFPTEHWNDSIRADEIVIGHFTWGDYLSGAVQADELRSEITALARARAVPWENLGPILVCLDERIWATRDYRYPTIVARFEDQIGSPILIAAFADGHVEYVHSLDGALAEGFKRLEEDSMMTAGSLGWNSTISAWLDE